MRSTRWGAAAIVALALAASVTGLRNGFALDDVPIISGNAHLHQLGDAWSLFARPYWPAELGGGLYRPLSTLIMCLLWVVGRGAPIAFHLANVLLYAGVATAVYALATRLLEPAAAWMAAAVYAVHPVHVEVVANGVGICELLAAITVLGAVICYLDMRRLDPTPFPPARLGMIAALYLAGLASKENAIALPALLGVAEVTVVTDFRSWRERLTALRPLIAVLVLITVGYIGIRATVIGSVVGDAPSMALRGATWDTRWWTAISVVPEWLRLLLWPAQLGALHSPPDTPVWTGFDVLLLPALLVFVSIPLLVALAWRRVPVLAFGVAWMALALAPASNLIVPSGVLLADRILFLPSVGFVLAFGAVVSRVQLGQSWVRVTVAGLLGLGLWKSANRGPVWRDDATLFAQSAIDTPRSYRARFAYAGQLFAERRMADGERESRAALQLFDGDPRVSTALATEYAMAGQCRLAEPLFRQALFLAPQYFAPRIRLANCLLQDGDYAGARSLAVVGASYGVNPVTYGQVIRMADSALFHSATAARP